MKKIYKNSILNVKGTDKFDNTFLFEYLLHSFNKREVGGELWKSVEIIYLRELLKFHKNEEIFKRVSEKPAMYSEVYSSKEELRIFTELFENAISQKKQIHIIGITLKEEIQMLEKYYTELGFMREDINCFEVDFSIPLVTVSCYIENLMWKGSDYKRMWEEIFFCPPIRESGQNKALFKWITRGVIAGIEIWEITKDKEQFLWDCIRQEKILPLQMGRILKYNLEEVGLKGEIEELQVKY